MTNDKIDELIDALTLKNDDWVEINSSGARKAVKAIKQLRKERDELRDALRHADTNIKFLSMAIKEDDPKSQLELRCKDARRYIQQALKKAGEA